MLSIQINLNESIIKINMNNSDYETLTEQQNWRFNNKRDNNKNVYINIDILIIVNNGWKEMVDFIKVVDNIKRCAYQNTRQYQAVFCP
jgi:hypothetical protein